MKKSLEIVFGIILAGFIIFGAYSLFNKFFNSEDKPSVSSKTVLTEIQSISSAALSQFMIDSLADMLNYPNGITYARVNGVNATGDGFKELKLNGNNNFNYYIHFNLKSNITEFYFRNSEFQYIYKGNGFNSSNLTSVKISSEGKADQNKSLIGNIINDDVNTITNIDTGVINLNEILNYKDGYIKLYFEMKENKVIPKFEYVK